MSSNARTHPSNCPCNACACRRIGKAAGRKGNEPPVTQGLAVVSGGLAVAEGSRARQHRRYVARVRQAVRVSPAATGTFSSEKARAVIASSKPIKTHMALATKHGRYAAGLGLASAGLGGATVAINRHGRPTSEGVRKSAFGVIH